jgi:hypothetical protein
LASSDYAFIAGDGRKEHRTADKMMRMEEVWMVHFTTNQSYELSLQLISTIKCENGQRKQLLSSAADHDLKTAGNTWVKSGHTLLLNVDVASV